MPSREIAEYTGKLHTNVIADIRTMLEQLELGELSFQSSYLTEQNKRVIMFVLPKDLTITLVSGYSAPMHEQLEIGERSFALTFKSPARTAPAVHPQSSGSPRT